MLESTLKSARSCFAARLSDPLYRDEQMLNQVAIDCIDECLTMQKVQAEQIKVNKEVDRQMYRLFFGTADEEEVDSLFSAAEFDKWCDDLDEGIEEARANERIEVLDGCESRISDAL